MIHGNVELIPEARTVPLVLIDFLLKVLELRNFVLLIFFENSIANVFDLIVSFYFPDGPKYEMILKAEKLKKKK